MPEFFLELFSEEIPARMQARAADDLVRLVTEALAPLSPNAARGFYGPRRIAMVAQLASEVAASSSTERGPRANAPEQALAGFLRKHNAIREQLRQEGDFWVLEKASAGASAADLIGTALPALLRRFPWPKSMRWGGTSQFTWVRPLRRIVCLFDGAIVAFSLADGADDGHGLASGDLTEGHRFLAPGAFAVTGCADWQAKLRDHKVLSDAAERKRVIADAVAAAASAHGVTVMEDAGLLDEVAGLVEWPVVLLGRIDAAYMDLPAEVMQVSMRVNQRYFALRHPDCSAAPYFAFAANIEAIDGGSAIIAGNERVLRARFADARHFWDLDRKARLEDLVPKLDQVIFHAKLGSQGDRVRRLIALAEAIAPLVGADPALARRAAGLSKADLLTGMVGEFPELQGVMGNYYARNDGENRSVADAIREHYAPKGQGDAVPRAPVAIAVALADKLDQLTGFFAIDEKPTGSGDPYALRRAALGIIRIIMENNLRVGLNRLIVAAVRDHLSRTTLSDEVRDFIVDRFRIQLLSEGASHDVLMAVFADGANDDLVRTLKRVKAIRAFIRPVHTTGNLTLALTGVAATSAAGTLGVSNGPALLAAYRRAANILRIEDKKDGPHDGVPDAGLLTEPEEIAVAEALGGAALRIEAFLAAEDDSGAMTAMAGLRAPLDAFFEKVTVNAPEPELRENRLRLLSRVRATMDRIADFSKIEG